MSIPETSSPILEFAIERNTEKEIFRISHQNQPLLLANSFSSHWFPLLPAMSMEEISLTQWKKIIAYVSEMAKKLSTTKQLDTLQLKIVVGNYPWYLALQSASLFLKLPSTIPHQSLEIIYEENPVNLSIYGKIKLFATMEDMMQLKDTLIHGYHNILNED